MSTAASSSAPPTVVRSQSTSSRSHSYRPPSSDLPHRTRSLAAKPPPSSVSHPPSTSRSHSYDRRPPSNQAAFNNVARPSSSRRDPSRDRSEERPPAAYRNESGRTHQKTQSRHSSSYQRDSLDMAAAGPVPVEGAAAPGQPASSSSAQTRRRTTITTPTGQWALGKTIGAGSMGKVKIAKNMETGEQVSLPSCLCHLSRRH